jgi:hypothetical protein
MKGNLDEMKGPLSGGTQSPQEIPQGCQHGRGHFPQPQYSPGESLQTGTESCFQAKIAGKKSAARSSNMV